MPEPCSEFPAGKYESIIRIDRNRSDTTATMVEPLTDLGLGLGIPDEHAAVGTNGDKPPAVGTIGQTSDGASVTGHVLWRWIPGLPAIEELDRSVEAPCDHLIRSRAQRELLGRGDSRYRRGAGRIPTGYRPDPGHGAAAACDDSTVLIAECSGNGVSGRVPVIVGPPVPGMSQRRRRRNPRRQRQHLERPATAAQEQQCAIVRESQRQRVPALTRNDQP